MRLIRRRFARACIFIAGLGYAVPGTVLALGLLSPLVAIDEAISGSPDALTGIQRRAGAGRIERRRRDRLCGALPRHLDRASRRRGSPGFRTDLDDAARTAGTRPCAVIRSIHLPLMRPALWGTALLVFVDCLKELPATLLLRPLNVETLSTYIYQFATRGNFEDGALAALLIVLVGISR